MKKMIYTYKEILEMVAEANDISIDDVSFTFKHDFGYSCAQATYIVLPQKSEINIPKKVYKAIGVTDFNFMNFEHSTRWGRYIIKIWNVDRTISERLHREQEEYESGD